MGFLDAYGLSVPLPEKYGEPELPFASTYLTFFGSLEWSGTVGITFGFYCGTALVCSPLAIVYFSL
jgi:hypothetical protein